MKRFHATSVALLLAIVAIVAVQANTFQSEFADHPDESVHFVTGAMVYDYIKTSLGSSPMAFAADYYAHYPKIGIGHWPPFFYVLEATAFAVGGPTTNAAMSVVVVCLAATILALYGCLRRVYDNATALWCSALPLALPAFRQTGTLLLPDIVVTMFSLFAVLAFAKFLETDRLRDALWFALWSILAILTKGNAMALAVFVWLAILFNGQFRVVRSWRFWCAGAIVGVATLPYYLAFWTMMTDVGGGGGLDKSYLWRNLQGFSWRFGMVMGLAAAAMAAVGAGVALFGRVVQDSEQDGARLARTAAAHVAAVFLFHLLCPINGELRYLVPMVPTAFILIADLTARLRRFGLPWYVLWVSAASLAVVVPHAFSRLSALSSQRIVGYRAAVRELSNNGGATVIMVSSAPGGEGALVAARRLQDEALNDYMVRASKLLAADSWSGLNYRLAVTRDEALQMLRDLPIHFLILEDFGYRQGLIDDHHILLDELIATSPDDFVKVGEFPLHAGGQTIPAGLRVYEVVGNRGREPGRELSESLTNLAPSATRQHAAVPGNE
jgi:hypothetical protein